MVGVVEVVDVAVCAASGEISRYRRSKLAICWNAGAATTPPKIAPCGSSTVTSTRSRGRDAGTMPTKDATYFPLAYPPCESGFCAVPVFPAT